MPVVSSMRLSAASARKPATMLSPEAQNLALQAESARLKALVDELDLAQLSANNRRGAVARPFRAGAKTERAAGCLSAGAAQSAKQPAPAGRRKRRWRVPNCWRRTVKTCRRTSPPSLRSTVSSPGALNQQAQRMDLVASQQRQATNQTLQVRRGVKHPARAVAVAGLLQSAGRSPARQWRGCRSALARSSWIRKWRSCACSVCALKIC